MLIKLIPVVLVCCSLLMITACKEEPGGSLSDDGIINGDITVITDRTDVTDTWFEDYRARFNQKYPDVNVKFEALSDYEGMMRLRMNANEYGDVLFIPRNIKTADLPDFFEPLGETTKLEKTYYHAEDHSCNGLTYGIPFSIAIPGIVYNKEVFSSAGLSSVSIEPDRFLDEMNKIKKSTHAIPYSTNYSNGWTLLNWEFHAMALSKQPDYYSVTMPDSDSPFSPGTPYYETYKLLYELARQGLIEKDPMTDQSGMGELAHGNVGAMHLDSSGLAYIRSIAPKAGDIGFLPFSFEVNGKNIPLSYGGYSVAINKHSSNKDAARAWLDWFLNESGYYKTADGISSVKTADWPAALSDLRNFELDESSSGVTSPAKKSVEQIDSDGMVGMWLPDYKREIILSGTGVNSKSFDDIMEELNKKWRNGRSK
ncbi:extracellular solute-binding protein [Paenibacillus sp. HN-1]|uniref:ABC transporter substrate-binding protein n=1 Tax=Paenibacillus TaxID=44249 RepID=UPI001CAA2E47|nr:MULTISPECIES: extracellular solute-binding protein [Paenibacillus]MBY9081996.1 extracellular solute-binding protein [Paenibacillus sp. CGMCC 1.18879]MBY9085846.1 extracellular solute-binding protein [Paenibacillus sinensis]